MNFVRVVQWLLLFICLIFAVLFGWVFYFRMGLEYNSEGRWFDPDSEVVYHEQAVGFFGVLLVISVVILSVVAYWIWTSSGNEVPEDKLPG